MFVVVVVTFTGDLQVYTWFCYLCAGDVVVAVIIVVVMYWE